ncbi:MAG TPA: tRNA uridine(34) 5-carboxymethylaminomethyl modification radical SAM/GNAT enzyme Elp3 [Candidatus Moranbacteria bacterium]|nr:tRNA uridine(34) 5-carboxymethylaminomethyl modification radical SAM/GNAT enzyme Elp3 [Candidatus Moranbacteria bacterium]HAT74945.1 tRNA uridine(34) 5-carboxymethylaminomethyl modification radical SAM/GNAT enzyme Elp3 [Candidatus Moranbacteria bacterium]
MPQSYGNFVKLAMRETAETPDDFLRVKKNICKKLKIQPPTNADIREAYEKMVAEKQIKRNLLFEKLLIGKKMRTQSGVAVIAVLTKPYGCPGKCLYCPTEKNMPKSYLKNEPAVMRAIIAKFNPYIQTQKRIRALELNGHKTDKIELIVMGGTFSYFPKSYQKKFIAECFRACNDYPSSPPLLTKERVEVRLTREQTRNETAKCRIIGLTLETRPDYIDEKEILNFRNLGCTRVELGAQSIFDDVLKLNKRGHNVSETIHATKLLKNAGFKINYHTMPGLYGSNLKKDYKMFQELFSNSDFQPDMLKIYPTIVLKDSELYNVWKKGSYKALTDKQFEKNILRVKEKIIPPYVRIARLVRDVPAESILAGPIISNLRQLIAKKSHCQCIRCREVRGNYNMDENIILNRIDYNASGGKEIFLEYVSSDKKKLFALLRLRIPSASFVETHCNASLQQNEKLYNFFPALKNAALIREVHTYGKMAEINKQDKESPQHIGFGKKLVLEAEKIARKEFGFKKIAIISGIGARNYYRKLGYRLKDSYMVKKI